MTGKCDLCGQVVNLISVTDQPDMHDGDFCENCLVKMGVLDARELEKNNNEVNPQYAKNRRV